MANNLGSNIRSFRKNKGFTQEELAGMLGVTPQAVSRWESEAGLERQQRACSGRTEY